MLRRLAHSLANNDLEASIAEQKALHDASKKLLEADMKDHEHLFKWSQSEKNPVFKDVFERNLQLTHVRFDAFQKFMAKMREARQHYKTISKEERGIEDVRKQHANVCTRLGRLKKQVDNATKKNDVSKVESLLPELQAVLGQNDQATIHLEEEMERLEIYKVKCVRDALRLQAEAYLLLASYLVRVGEAQQSLAELVPDDPPNIAGYDSYKDGPKQSSDIVDELCQSLSFSKPSESFIVVDVDTHGGSTLTTTTSGFSPSTSPPNSRVLPAPSERPPLLPPRPSKPEYLALDVGKVVADSLDDTSADYVAHEDVEAERRRAILNASAIALGKPPVARKPKLEGRDSFNKESGVFRQHYTLPRKNNNGNNDNEDSSSDQEQPYKVSQADAGITPEANPSPKWKHQPQPLVLDQKSPPSTTPAATAAVSSTPPMPTRLAGQAGSKSSPPTLRHPVVAANGVSAPTSGKDKPSDPSAYQDPADAYIWLWPKGKGEASTAEVNLPDPTDDYQKPWEVVSREESMQKLKSQCMPRRSMRRSSSNSPPQLGSARRQSLGPATPAAATAGKTESVDSGSGNQLSVPSQDRESVSLQSTLRRMTISLNRSEKLQATIVSSTSFEYDHLAGYQDGPGSDDIHFPAQANRLSGSLSDHDYDSPSEFHVDTGTGSLSKSSSLQRSRSLGDREFPVMATATAAAAAESKEGSLRMRLRHRLSALSNSSGATPPNGSPIIVRKRSVPVVHAGDNPRIVRLSQLSQFERQ